jgi:hypothetical protein
VFTSSKEAIDHMGAKGKIKTNSWGVCDDTFHYSSLMMEAARTSETSVDNHFTRQYNPEDSSEHP